MTRNIFPLIYDVYSFDFELETAAASLAKTGLAHAIPDDGVFDIKKVGDFCFHFFLKPSCRPSRLYNILINAFYLRHYGAITDSDLRHYLLPL